MPTRSRRPDKPVEAAGLDPRLRELVAVTPFPVLALSLDRYVIEAASPAASQLLGVGHPLVGEMWENLLTDSPTGGLELLRAGRLTGYETVRRFGDPSGTDRELQIWVRGVETDPPVNHALLLLSATGRVRGDAVGSGLGTDGIKVLGATDPDLNVDRISADIEQLTGIPVADVLHQSLLRLVSEADVGALLVAVGQVAASGRGASIALRARTDGDGLVLCECALLPLHPPPCVAFALLEPRLEPAPAAGQGAADRVLSLFQDVVTSAEASRGLSGAFSPAVDVSGLPARELDIVRRLVGGDRVPKIAKDMFLSQSTVRSHLSAVFARFGVSSQQELITLLRADPGPTDDRRP